MKQFYDKIIHFKLNSKNNFSKEVTPVLNDTWWMNEINCIKEKGPFQAKGMTLLRLCGKRRHGKLEKIKKLCSQVVECGVNKCYRTGKVGCLGHTGHVVVVTFY